jgi:23S rRNA pseudouridine1911/1915/1917 synthase
LHAACLSFEHPASGVACRFDSPLPEDMTLLLESLRKDAASAAPARRG